MKESSLNRIKAYIHWIKQEKEPDEDRLLMANDIEKLLKVAEAAREMLELKFTLYPCEIDRDCRPCNLKQAFDELEK